MPSYRDVARLPIGKLLGPEDIPEIVTLDTPIKEVASRLRRGPAHAALVTLPGGDDTQVVGVVEEGEVIDAIVNQNRDPNTLLRDLLGNRPPPRTVPDHVAVAELPIYTEPQSILIVTDDSGRPRALVHRELLANRIRRLAYT
jgi:CBS domain-containing protein